MDHRVLLVTDDPRWYATCSRALAGLCDVERAQTQGEVRSALARMRFSLAIVSFRLRRAHGLAAVQEISDDPHAPPVLVVITFEDTDNRKAAYSGGASAIIYQCGSDELRMRIEKDLARIAAVGRIDADAVPPPREFVRGNTRLGLENPTITVSGRANALSPAEHRIILSLIRSFGRCVSRATLEAAANPFRVCADSAAALDNHVARLRKKLAGSDLAVETVRSVGYVLTSFNSETCDRDAGPASVTRAREAARSGTHARATPLAPANERTEPRAEPREGSGKR